MPGIRHYTSWWRHNISSHSLLSSCYRVDIELTLGACVKMDDMFSVTFVLLIEFFYMVAGESFGLNVALAIHPCRRTCAFHKRRSSSRSRSNVRTLNRNSVFEHSRAWHSCNQRYQYEYERFTYYWKIQSYMCMGHHSNDAAHWNQSSWKLIQYLPTHS